MATLTKAQRSIAIGAVRSQLRATGKDPATVSILEAEEVLDHLNRTVPDTVAAQWYASASRNQWNLFCREWRKWQGGYGERH